MQRCRYSRESLYSRICALVLLPAIVIVLLVISIFILATEGPVAASFPSLSTIILAMFVFIPSALLESREYSVSAYGIDVGGFLRKSVHFEWDDISEVGIYAFHANGSVTDYCSVICCFISNRPACFARKMTKAYFYAAFRQRTVIVIDYSNDIFEEIVAVYPHEIKDNRPEQIRMFNLETYRKMTS